MTEWLKSSMPAWARPALDWLITPQVLATVTLLSLLLLVASVVALPWFVARLPRDYFVRHDHEAPISVIRSPKWRRPLHVAKNVAGGLLLVAGLAMLVLPGQGILTIVMALVLLDFPGKRTLERKLVARPHVMRALNALRRRAGAPPLILD
ncbi:MAG: PGPGW domain-containing protein [Myxococcales bacterium]|nr:PGPGW domain-containing protein [Myxococcales bacterium]